MRATTWAMMGLFVVVAGCSETDGRWTVGRQFAPMRTPKTASAAHRRDNPSEADTSRGPALPDIRIADGQEVDLARDVAVSRTRYAAALSALRAYYESNGDHDKLRDCEREIVEASRINPPAYVDDAAIPDTQLRPLESIAAADALYDRALNLMEEGGYGQPTHVKSARLQSAYETLVKLIDGYPDSDKIDDAAFCCGEIIKECFPDRTADAITWYTRCISWDPHTPHPARLQAAILYDYRLNNPQRAIPLYRAALRRDGATAGEVALAASRIESLAGGPNDDEMQPQQARPMRHRPHQASPAPDAMPMTPMQADARAVDPSDPLTDTPSAC